MSQDRSQDRPQSYDLEALKARVPADRGEYFAGYAVSVEDAGGWRFSRREASAGAYGRPTVRTVWDEPDGPAGRVAIDVSECGSASEALEALAERLAWNELAELPEGPAGLGLAAFAHPEGVTPALFFVRGNLALSLVSYGSRPVAVLPWAERLSQRLGARPRSERAGVALQLEAQRAKVGSPVGLSYHLPWKLGDEGYVKLFVTGGTIERRDDRFLVTPAAAGELTIEAWAVEPGREAYGGSARLAVEQD
jgi:hypothetical protein